MIDADRLQRMIEQREARKQERKAQEKISIRQYKIRNFMIFLGLIALILIAGLITYEHNARYSFDTTAQIVVQQGDSLWTLAEQARTNPRQDIRQIVFIIEQQNELAGGFIFPDQILVIPIFSRE